MRRCKENRQCEIKGVGNVGIRGHVKAGNQGGDEARNALVF